MSYSLENIPYNLVICRYSEIALKKKNRWMFEQFLIGRISSLLGQIKKIKVTKIRGRVLIHYYDWSELSLEDRKTICDALKYVFGLDSFSFVIKTSPDMNEMSKFVMSTIGYVIEELRNQAGKRKELSFRVRVKRIDKSLCPKRDIEILLAEQILTKYEGLKVDLIDAELSLYCEIHEDVAFIFYNMEKGQKGLPSGSNPPVLALLSGGFDSPVAAYMMMRRGVFVDFLSFHSYPFTPKTTEEKVIKIVKHLNKYQGARRLFLCNLLEVQKEVCAKTFETFRTIHYRRLMFKLAEKIAIKNGNKALVTGESVGQVASQTITNLANIDNATEMLILRPVIGMDKESTMDIARKLGTFELSAVQVPDSCTVFSPSNPSTGAPLARILIGENRMNIEALLDIAWKSTVAVDVETGIETPITELFQE